MIPSSIDGSHDRPSLFDPDWTGQRSKAVCRHNTRLGRYFLRSCRFITPADVLLGSSSPPRVHPPVHRTSDQTHNLRILLMCDIVRRVPLTLAHPAHPTLHSEHQDPIRELTKVHLLNNTTIIVTRS